LSASGNLLYREFGLVLATERKRKHLSQKQFGAKVGLSRTSVTNIECGRQPIQLHQLYLFAATLRVEVAKLLPKEAPVLLEEVHTAENKEAQYLADIEDVLSHQLQMTKSES
jgi:transcriptional regulator with XRE-family HTH domain